MSLVWDGLDLQPAHRRWRFWIAVGRDELPETRASSQLIPFVRGRLHQAGVADRRVLEVRGYIKELSDPAMQAELDAIKQSLDPERSVPGVLTDTFADGSVRWLTAVPRNAISRYAGDAGRLLSLELEALDPFWYRTWGAWVLDSGLYLDEGLLLDEATEIVIHPHASPETISFTAVGTAEGTLVRIEADGPSTGGQLVVTNVSADGAPSFSHPALLAGEALVVDSGLRVVTLNGGNHRGSLVLGAGNRHGEYFRLRPGLNTIQISGLPAELRVSFPATYL
jgi:hypothetical protein